MAKTRAHSSGKGTIRRHAGGLRAVALLEAAKGAVVVLVGFELLTMIHRDVQAIAEEVVRHIHINPARHYPQIFLDAASRATDGRLWVMALTALVYALVRFIEAFGLWRQREWAIWFGILSGGIYLPLEAYELTVSVSPVKAVVLLVNVLIVGWLAWVRWQERKR